MSTAVPDLALPRLIVHAPVDVAAAVAVGVPVIVQSPPDCPLRQGVPWFAALVAGVRPPVLPVLDCGAAPGLALAALRLGVPVVRIAPGPEVRIAPGPEVRIAPDSAPTALAAIAAEMGARVDTTAPTAVLDLRGVADPVAACRRFLALA